MQLILDNLQKKFNKKEVLKGITYTFEQGTIYGIIGRNGAGKTTLFNCVSSNIEVDFGNIYLNIDGINRTLTYDDIGMVSASPSLPDFLTGYEYIKCYLDLNKNKVQSNKSIDDYFDIIRFTEEDRYQLIKEYSYGMKNKIQLLCCLITGPRIILLDEPLTSFDIIVAHDIKELLIEIKTNHIILLSTHILQIARDVCDDIIILSNGTLDDSIKLKDENFEEHLIQALKVV